MMGRRLSRCALLLVVALAAAGCDFTGINSMSLPLTAGGDSDDLRVTVMMRNVTNLVPNSDVRYGEVIVGSVRKIEFDNWKAKLTIGLSADAKIPAAVRAKVAQKSLLGAEYLELSAPAGSKGSTGPLLVDGAVIDLDRTGRYPETEEVLAAAALLLNGGGLPQVQTIAHELNAAMTGRTGDIKSLVAELTRFTAALDEQRNEIVGAMDSLDRLSRGIVKERDGIARALGQLPKGIDALRAERHQLVNALQSLESLSGVSHRVLSRTEDGLVDNLDNLTPLTRQIADHADNLANSVDGITYPFPIRAINNAFFGDYINFFARFHLDLRDFAQRHTDGTSLESLISVLFGIPPTATGQQDPLSLPDLSNQLPIGANNQNPGADAGVLLDGLLGGLLGGKR
jgi:phospholipid/cholesterol/gamma-HCH transport system substrate-binding protein